MDKLMQNYVNNQICVICLSAVRNINTLDIDFS